MHKLQVNNCHIKAWPTKHGGGTRRTARIIVGGRKEGNGGRRVGRREGRKKGGREGEREGGRKRRKKRGMEEGRMRATECLTTTMILICEGLNVWNSVASDGFSIKASSMRRMEVIRSEM